MELPTPLDGVEPKEPVKRAGVEDEFVKLGGATEVPGCELLETKPPGGAYTDPLGGATSEGVVVLPTPTLPVGGGGTVVRPRNGSSCVGRFRQPDAVNNAAAITIVRHMDRLRSATMCESAARASYRRADPKEGAAKIAKRSKRSRALAALPACRTRRRDAPTTPDRLSLPAFRRPYLCDVVRNGVTWGLMIRSGATAADLFALGVAFLVGAVLFDLRGIGAAFDFGGAADGPPSFGTAS